jgi:hypothetical protein
MKLLRRQDFFEAARLLHLNNLPEMELASAGSLWVECWLSEAQILCVTSNSIAVTDA